MNRKTGIICFPTDYYLAIGIKSGADTVENVGDFERPIYDDLSHSSTRTIGVDIHSGMYALYIFVTKPLSSTGHVLF